jgi:hypothetical protein
MKKLNPVLAALALSASCAAMPLIAHASDDDDWSALSAQWWQWALSIPAASNPVADADGASCTVPANSPLFFPVINSAFVDTPDCGQEGKSYSVEEMRAILDPILDGASGIEATLDNRPIKSVRRVKSKVFAAVFPANSLWDAPGTSCLVPGRIYSPSVDDGYYVRLRGLPEGVHQLAFRGAFADGFSIDVVYTLNAVKVISK